MRLPFLFYFILLYGLFSCESPPEKNDIPLFTNGQGAYACYRIPAIVNSPNGNLIAFAEGRTKDCNDFGDVDILMSNSNDGGLNWSEPVVVAQFGELQAGNPAPVWDTLDPRFPQGRLFLFYNTGDVSEHDMRQGNGSRQVLFITSTDEGASWSAPREITKWVHFNKSSTQPRKDWRTNATTPGHAIQLKVKPYTRRLYIPANHSQGDPQEGFNEYRAYGFYSDDHGLSWAVSPDIEVPSSNEAIGVELPDGKLMLNIREQNGNSKRRLVVLSEDGGISWKENYFDQALISPVCQSSILLFKGKKDTLLLFSGPNSETKREQMTIKGSHDFGQSWPLTKKIYSGTSAYSDLVQIDANTLGLLYERDRNGIHFVRIPLYQLLREQ